MRGTPGIAISVLHQVSAELQGPETLVRIRPGIVDLRPESAPKPDETNPKMPGAVPTNRHKPSPTDFGPVSGYFDHDPKLLNYEIPQPRAVCPGGKGRWYEGAEGGGEGGRPSIRPFER